MNLLSSVADIFNVFETIKKCFVILNKKSLIQHISLLDEGERGMSDSNAVQSKLSSIKTELLVAWIFAIIVVVI